MLNLSLGYKLPPYKSGGVQFLAPACDGEVDRVLTALVFQLEEVLFVAQPLYLLPERSYLRVDI